MKRTFRRPDPVVFCGSGNQVCGRRDAARAIRERSKAAAVSGHLAWK